MPRSRQMCVAVVMSVRALAVYEAVNAEIDFNNKNNTRVNVKLVDLK